jgi:hypothetical protein
MNVQQLSVFLENKPGRLQKVLEVLAEKEINILTLNIAEIKDFGIVRMIVNRPEDAHQALREEHITCSVNDVLGIGVEDTPGSLLKLINTFTEKNLNIEYMYAFTEKRGSKAVMILRFEDIEGAKTALTAEGYDIMKRIDIIGEQIK